MIPSEVYALGASGNPIREIADYAMRRAEEVGAENVQASRRPRRCRRRRSAL